MNMNLNVSMSNNRGDDAQMEFTAMLPHYHGLNSEVQESSNIMEETLHYMRECKHKIESSSRDCNKAGEIKSAVRMLVNHTKEHLSREIHQYDKIIKQAHTTQYEFNRVLLLASSDYQKSLSTIHQLSNDIREKKDELRKISALQDQQKILQMKHNLQKQYYIGKSVGNNTNNVQTQEKEEDKQNSNNNGNKNNHNHSQFEFWKRILQERLLKLQSQVSYQRKELTIFLFNANKTLKQLANNITTMYLSQFKFNQSPSFALSPSIPPIPSQILYSQYEERERQMELFDQRDISSLRKRIGNIQIEQDTDGQVYNYNQRMQISDVMPRA